jgi:predicted amidohydrolase
MSGSIRVALVQFAASDNPADNAERISAHIRAAAADGAALVVFPEAAMCRFGVSLGAVAEDLDGPWASAIAATAVETGVHVVAGMYRPGDAGRVRNTLLVVSPDGDRRGYDKIHLYDAFGFTESRTVQPGAEPLLIEVDGVGVGVATCYDIRFPALFTTLAAAGAQVITVSASWGDGPGKVDAWTTLARARALDSTCFVLAVDQPLPPGPPATAPLGVGASIAVAPDGTVIEQLGAEPGRLLVDVDTAAVDRARRSLPVLANRRDIPRPVGA